VVLLLIPWQRGASEAAAQALAVTFEPVVSGLSQPIFVTAAPDGSGRLFVVERGGQIKIVTGQGVLATPFLNISSLLVSGGSEQGLLGLAFDPSFRTNRRFYVFYTAASPSGQLTVARYTASLSNPNVADTNGTILLGVPHAQFSNHNGGMLAFGSDGMLYVSTGDGGSSGDPDGNAQNLNVLLGKLLRLDVRGTSAAIPPSNPFAGQSGRRGEIWAYGLRNPWRFSFDRLTGEVYIGDVGQGVWEEVDYQPAGSPGGLNYGWDIREGAHCFGASTCNTSGLTDPILEYNRSGFSPCGSVTGGYVSRGRWAPALYGEYLYADYCTGQIWRAEQTGGVWGSTELTDRAHQISSFGESERGELHVVNYSGGQILRLEQRCPEGQYRADYFPTANQGVDPQLSRCETGLNQDWGSGSPDPGLPPNGFSARWLGHHTFTAGSYRFIGQAEGGLRVYLDGQLLIDGWSVPSGTEVRAAGC
jgi:hypothetical protein